MTDIVIYTTEKGNVALDVSLTEDTVWLSLNQMAQLFGRDKSVISRHLKSIFADGELDKTAVVAKYATTASDGKSYQVDHYNLDVIISLGYRVNSKEGIRFRRWATNVLKHHLIRGYTIHEKRLAERGFEELGQAIELLKKTLAHHELVNDLGQEAIQLIINYAKTWGLLLAYDEDALPAPQPTQGNKSHSTLSHEQAISAIKALKIELAARNEASDLFGKDRENKLESLLHSIDQTFDGVALYQSIEEKAAHLLYFIIKDHPFIDGNKRIGSLLFLLYLASQNKPARLNDNGLVALALLVAESQPAQKSLIIRLISQMLV